MSTAFELKQVVVRDSGTGSVVEGAVVTVFLDNGSGGKGALASSVFAVNGSAVNQTTSPLTTNAQGVVLFRLPAGVYFLEAEWGPNLVTRPGFNVGMASARDVGSGAQQLALPGSIPAALLGRAPVGGDAGAFFFFNSGGGYVLGRLWDIAPPDDRQAGRVMVINSGVDGFQFVDLPPGVLPVLTGNAGRVLAVNEDADEAVWVDPPELVFPSFSGQGGRVLRVRSDESDLEWADPAPRYLVQDVSAAGNRTLTAGDHNTIVEATGTAAVNFILPLNSAEAVPVGSLVILTKAGTGDVSISAASGVTLNGQSALSVVVPDQWDVVTLYKRSVNGWVISGRFEVP